MGTAREDLPDLVSKLDMPDMICPTSPNFFFFFFGLGFNPSRAQ